MIECLSCNMHLTRMLSNSSVPWKVPTVLRFCVLSSWLRITSFNKSHCNHAVFRWLPAVPTRLSSCQQFLGFFLGASAALLRFAHPSVGNTTSNLMALHPANFSLKSYLCKWTPCIVQTREYRERQLANRIGSWLHRI